MAPREALSAFEVDPVGLRDLSLDLQVKGLELLPGIVNQVFGSPLLVADSAVSDLERRLVVHSFVEALRAFEYRFSLHRLTPCAACRVPDPLVMFVVFALSPGLYVASFGFIG